MPEAEIPVDEAPSPPSSSERTTRDPFIGPLPQDNGNPNGVATEPPRAASIGGDHFVAIRNMLNASRNRPAARFSPLEPSFVPAPTRYYPIVIPAEPTIEELLRQAAGTDDLQSVSEIKLKVISHLTSLQRIPLYIPNLRTLILEGSIVMTLRDLGCDMTTLRLLNVSRCSLKNLDGTSGLESLEELVADFNLIEEVGPCTNLTNIKKISLKGNRVTDLGSITFLALCKKLECLDLRENFVSENPSFRHMLKENIPQLRKLNEVPFSETTNEDTDLSSSEYRSSSSSTEDERRGRWQNLLETRKPEWRPTTAHIERRVTVELLDKERPATADPVKLKAQLTSGEPVVGSIVTKARRRRRQRTAWGESTSCSSVSSSDSSFSRDFPDRLPQKTVDLELGVIGVQEQQAAQVEGDDPQSLLRAARMWRQRSVQAREAIWENDQAMVLRQLSED